MSAISPPLLMDRSPRRFRRLAAVLRARTQWLGLVRSGQGLACLHIQLDKD
jgi:hypothetical protein